MAYDSAMAVLLRGRILTSTADIPQIGWIYIVEDRIAGLGTGDPPARYANADETVAGDERTLIAPGFIDAHNHLPQFNSIGCDGLELLDWLNEIIFPAESEWQDSDLAIDDTRRSLQRMLKSGTTAFAGNLTSHSTGIPAFSHLQDSHPIRAIIGRVLMDRNAPANLCTPGPWEINEYLPTCKPLQAHGSRLSINPRFAIACSSEALQFAGKQASRESNVWVQTHLAESIAECDQVHSLFPDAPHYAGVYDEFGLLHERTLLAHCNHLSLDEWKLIASRKAIVVHCPVANIFLESGSFDLKQAQSHGVRVALGSDVAAGVEVAMPRVARSMIETAKWRRRTIDPDAPIPTPAQAWSMITKGNAAMLGWPDAGVLSKGARADILIMQPDITRWDEHTFGRLMYGWEDEWIQHVLLAGRVRKTNI